MEASAARVSLPSWEERLAEIARGSEYALPAIDQKLQATEDDWNKVAQKRAAAWVRAVWGFTAVAMIGDWTSKKQERFIEITRRPVRVIDLAARGTRRVAEAGAQRARGEIHGASGVEETPPPPTGPPSGGAPQGPPASPQVRRWAEWMARQSAASKMREWALGMRQDVRWQVVQAIREGAPPDVLRKRLERRWVDYGQHFGMIAQTELAMAFNDGYLLAMPERAYVWVPPIGDARVCEECKQLLEGKVFEVLHHRPEHPVKLDWETKVWPGKTNADRKREDWVAAVPLHPRCRHAFAFYSGRPS